MDIFACGHFVIFAAMCTTLMLLYKMSWQAKPHFVFFAKMEKGNFFFSPTFFSSCIKNSLWEYKWCGSFVKVLNQTQNLMNFEHLFFMLNFKLSWFLKPIFEPHSKKSNLYRLDQPEMGQIQAQISKNRSLNFSKSYREVEFRTQ